MTQPASNRFALSLAIVLVAVIVLVLEYADQIDRWGLAHLFH